MTDPTIIWDIDKASVVYNQRVVDGISYRCELGFSAKNRQSGSVGSFHLTDDFAESVWEAIEKDELSIWMAKEVPN